MRVRACVCVVVVWGWGWGCTHPLFATTKQPTTTASTHITPTPAPTYTNVLEDPELPEGGDASKQPPLHPPKVQLLSAALQDSVTILSQVAQVISSAVLHSASE